MRNLSGSVRPAPVKPPERKPQPSVATPPKATGGHKVATPPPQKARPPVEEKKAPPPSTGPKKIAEISKEHMESNKPIRIEDLLKPIGKPGSTPAVPEVSEEDEQDDAKGKKKRPGELTGRDQRHKARQERARNRQAQTEGGGKALLLDETAERPATKQLHRIKRKIHRPTEPRKGKVPIELPITVRSLSAAMQMQSGKLLLKLMEHGVTATINSTLDSELAEALALEHDCVLDVKRAPNAEEQLIKELETPDASESLVTRAPIVTIMGHVDHGKTSLLDRIRQSNVVDTEAGGITQSIRAWRVDHNGRPITFLDTPGHEAFTKMRARGANVTDIAVIVVAADDGVMPQTEEAISHAKAAGVAIVVAINKVDLPAARGKIQQVESQLYGLGLLPDNMGGDVPFVQTSAATGKGIEDLLEAILLVADVQLEQKVKANPDRPARGTCLEASLDEGEGVFATLLVQNGTLHKGDVLLCGASYGRVRAMYNDLGQPIEEAGPSVPCRVTGLDEVPNADDPFAVVQDLITARDIAEKRKGRLQEAAMPGRNQLKLESILEKKPDELKIVLKADVRGSVEAIRKELEKLRHEEVRVRILHTGIGAINESDVSLALISPRDTIIVGFNVVPDDAARALAEERGVQLREYDIIYKLTDDIKAALEGKLKPREEIVHLGRAVVRETFKISRVGTIAGCRVTQGTIERSAKVRVIRNGIVVYPPADRTVGLDSLKRFKDDVKEVQQGYECGLKITGYDDVKVDDVIEAYRIDQVQRTLS
jgi:translation initiation factor IF-2